MRNLKELKKELEGKEISLQDLDTVMREITNCSFSIFSYGREYGNNFSWYSFPDCVPIGYNIDFEILNPKDDDLDIIVRVKEITELGKMDMHIHISVFTFKKQKDKEEFLC